MNKIISTLAFTVVGIISFSQSKLEVKSDTTTTFFTYISEETNGSISNCSVSIRLNEMNPSESKIEGTAQIENLSTGNPVRDKHLKSKTYFNSKEFSEIKFSSNDIHFNKEVNDSVAWVVCKGILEIKGFKKELIFKIAKNDKTLLLTSELYADDFGVAIKKGRETSLVNITIEVPYITLN